MGRVSYLMVPVEVRAMMSPDGRSVVGPSADFSKLPWFDRKHGVDRNSDSAFLAGTIFSSPFTNDNLYLEPGVHLHWILPEGLRRSLEGTDGKQFPAVPDRWYIRRVVPGKPEAAWVVESDYLWPAEFAGSPRMTQWPVDPDLPDATLRDRLSPHGQPYRFMGRQEPIARWKVNPRTGFDHWNLLRPETPLTALGWNHPHFDSFFPNCRSVFGMHDETVPAGAVTYQVIGWYANPDQDAVKRWHETHPANRAEDPEWTPLAGVADAFGWTVPEGTTYPEGGFELLCVGQVVVNPEKTGKAAGSPEGSAHGIRVGVGRCGSEALAALLANAALSDDTGLQGSSALQYSDEQELEDLIEAVLTSRQLAAQATDVGPRLAELRHEKSFTPVAGEMRWILKVEKKETGKAKKEGLGEAAAALIGKDATPAESAPLPPMPMKLHTLLVQLNRAQRQLDQAQDRLETMQSQLYADWCRFQTAMYPPEGELEDYPAVEKLRHFIEHVSLTAVLDAQASLGVLPDDATSGSSMDGKRGRPTFRGERDTAREVLEEALAEENRTLDDDSRKGGLKDSPWRWQLRESAGPRYWQANAPTVALAIDGDFQVDLGSSGPGACSVWEGQEFEALVKSKGDIPKKLEDALREAPTQVGAHQGPVHQQLEWHGEYMPIAEGHWSQRADGQYASDYVTHNHLLAENGIEHIPSPRVNGVNGLCRVGSELLGVAPLGADAHALMAERLEDYLRHLGDADGSGTGDEASATIRRRVEAIRKALTKLQKTSHFYVQPLSGFNQAMIQRHRLVRLKARDPLAFSDYQAFAGQVAKALGNSRGLGPEPLAELHSLRAGALRLRALSVVDSFGLVTEVPVTDVQLAETTKVPGMQDWLKLGPRFSQPVRIDFRWQTGTGKHSSDVLSPCCHGEPIRGWWVPNLLDGSLWVFAASGAALGALDQNGDWEPALFHGEAVKDRPHRELDRETVLKDGPIEGLDLTLHQVLRWLLKTRDDGATFVRSLLSNLEQSLDNIHPPGAAQVPGLAVFMGRPMAIARASLDLQLQGEPAINQSWSALLADMERGGRDAQGLAHIQLPMRLGEYRKVSDGLVGFWLEEKDGRLHNALNLNDALSAHFDRGDSAATNALKTLAGRLGKEVSEVLTELLEKDEDGWVKRQDLLGALPDGASVWEQLVTQKIIRVETRHEALHHYSDAETLSQSLADPPKMVTLLLDPHGAVHLTTGIAPVKQVDVPAEHFHEALQRIEVTLLTAPVLTPRKRLELSTPELEGHRWAWGELRRARAGEPSETQPTIAWLRPHVSREAFLGSWNGLAAPGPDPKKKARPEGAVLWKRLLETGWLKSAHAGDGPEAAQLAFIASLPPDREEAFFEGLLSPGADTAATRRERESLRQAVAATLERCRLGGQPYSDRAQFAEGLVLKEGWLLLDSSEARA